MTSWGFLTARLRDIAGRLGITGRSAHGIVSDLTAAGYVAKQKDGRRNRYQIQAHLPLPEPAGQQATIGELLDLLTSQREATEHTCPPTTPACLGLNAIVFSPPYPQGTVAVGDTWSRMRAAGLA